MARIIAAYSARGLTVRVFDEPGAALEWLQRPWYPARRKATENEAA